MTRMNILKSLPSRDASNFTKFQPDSSDKTSTKKLSVYVSTEEQTPAQVIKKDRSNILLRYLYQQLDKKNKNCDTSKRKVQEPALSSMLSDAEPKRKVAKNNQTT